MGCNFETCELRSEVDAAGATRILRDLATRCTDANSTPAFHRAIAQAIECLNRGELTSANTIINETAANVSGAIHQCGEGVCYFPPTASQEAALGKDWADAVRAGGRAGHPLQADEESTDAYHVLDGLRFAFGYLHLHRMGNNVVILRGGA